MIISSLIVGAAMQMSRTITVPDGEVAYLTTASPNTKMRMAQDGERVGILTTSGGTVSFSFSTDLGRTISRPLRLASGSGTETPSNAHIAMGGGKIWVSFRRGSKLYLMESNGVKPFTAATLIASDVRSTGMDESTYDHRGQWIGFADAGLVVAYPSTGPINVRAGRLSYPPKGGTTPGASKPSFKTPPFSLRTTPLLKAPRDRSAVRVYTSGRTARVMMARNIDPQWVVGMSRSRDGGRTWDILANTEASRDSHITYLGFQERGDDVRFKGIATANQPSDYELVVDSRTDREWLLIKGDGPTWGVGVWQVVTSKDLARGLFDGPALVQRAWTDSVFMRGMPTRRSADTDVTPILPGKPSLITSRGMNEIFWCQGYFMTESPGTAWQSSFVDSDLVATYVGERDPIWQKYITPLWDRAEGYRRTSNVRRALLTSMRTFVFGPEVVHLGTQKHPTRAGAFKTVYKPAITSDWVPLDPSEDTGSISWADCVSQGYNGLLGWVSGDRVCLRRLAVRIGR
ncbi:MAG TPA: hypothetical protein VK171_04340 [Fimbriimonas sp.]|nr:hypothetical protein [Fimbriimonas sp.]